MKSAEVVLAFAVIVAVSVCDANSVNNLTNGEENSVTEAVLEGTTLVKDLFEDSTKDLPEDSTTNAPPEDALNETTTLQFVTTVPSVTRNVTSTPTVHQNVTMALSTNQTSSLTGGKKRLSTEIDKSKCESLGLERPNAPECKCYKQKSAGTDTPRGFCYYYECSDKTLSKHKCEWIKE